MASQNVILNGEVVVVDTLLMAIVYLPISLPVAEANGFGMYMYINQATKFYTPDNRPKGFDNGFHHHGRDLLQRIKRVTVLVGQAIAMTW